MKELIGQYIIGLKVNNDQSILAFYTLNNTIAYQVDGDCCSESWFADITGVKALLGNKVTSVVKVSMDRIDDGRSRQEIDQAYGYKLTTDKGYVDIVFRNSSNGYYGGDIDLYKDILPSEMTSIVDDWSA